MKKILIVIDIQKGFMVNDSTIEAQKSIETLISEKIFDIVIATQYYNYANSPIIKFMGWNKFLSVDDQKLMNGVRNADYIFRKNRYSAFSQDLLALICRLNNNVLPEEVFLAGVDTECCVLATAIDFFESNIRPIVLCNYCGSSYGSEAKKAGLKSLESLVGKNNLSFRWLNTRQDIDTIISEAKKLEEKK